MSLFLSPFQTLPLLLSINRGLFLLLFLHRQPDIHMVLDTVSSTREDPKMAFSTSEH